MPGAAQETSTLTTPGAERVEQQQQNISELGETLQIQPQDQDFMLQPDNTKLMQGLGNNPEPTRAPTEKEEQILADIDTSHHPDLAKLVTKLRANPELIKHFVKENGETYGVNSDSINRQMDRIEKNLKAAERQLDYLKQNPAMEKHIERFQESGLTARAYLKKMGITSSRDRRDNIALVKALSAAEKVNRNIRHGSTVVAKPDVDGAAQLKRLDHLIDSGMVPELEEQWDTSASMSRNSQNHFISNKTATPHQMKVKNDELAREARLNKDQKERINPDMTEASRQALLKHRRYSQYHGERADKIQQNMTSGTIESSYIDKNGYKRDLGYANVDPETATKFNQQFNEPTQRLDNAATAVKDAAKDLRDAVKERDDLRAKVFKHALETGHDSQTKMAGWMKAEGLFKDILKQNNITLTELLNSDIASPEQRELMKMYDALVNRKADIFQKEIEQNINANNMEQAKKWIAYLKDDPFTVDLPKEQIEMLETMTRPVSKEANPFVALSRLFSKTTQVS